MARPVPASAAPYPSSTGPAQRNAAIWSATDDEILLQARASGLNWQPIANEHFPNKTANACRKRHERLIERRHVEEWDAQKLDLLAQEYLIVRKAMWEMLSERVGEKWTLVEAKVCPCAELEESRISDCCQCMEKGLRSLTATARLAQRRGSHGEGQLFDEQGISDHTSDSGICLTGSDTEMEVGQVPAITAQHSKSASWQAHETQHRPAQPAEHVRSRSLPQPLPLYQPPPPIIPAKRVLDCSNITPSPDDMTFPRPVATLSHALRDRTGRSGISIQSVLSPAESDTASRQSFPPARKLLQGCSPDIRQ